ncbi:ly-6/neurotoxin-like protein 1 isoform X1 [Mustela putorius furo]|uniref:Ly-6/neurotoxin-like protein 1 isoform X1 n=1 Tax=Mustela putorius furo TaxID=9669 RepID=A0A8U0RVF9_MUSPF|nr:ly-6/neurotoxin-like protein 1 isoform X1 [Mustela putorius furo]
MKAVVLLVALLCQGAWALRCHNCSSTGGSTCSGPIECPSRAQACISEKLTSGCFFCATGMDVLGGKYTLVAKTCVESCNYPIPVKARADIKEMQVFQHCCSTDLCNGAGNWGPGTTTVGLMLVATVLVTLPGAFL